jgi:hypothetical protein
MQIFDGKYLLMEILHAKAQSFRNGAKNAFAALDLILCAFA